MEPKIKEKYKLGYSSQTHNWVKPQGMIIKSKSSIFHFQPPKCLKLNFVEQLS